MKTLLKYKKEPDTVLFRTSNPANEIQKDPKISWDNPFKSLKVCAELNLDFIYHLKW
jgi:hypothetical protein